MSTSGTITTYAEVGIKEDISEIITNLSPTKTPFQTMIGNWPVWNTYYQWQEDQLLSPAANAQIEGSAATTAVSQPTVMRYNTTQILEKVAQTADTLDALKFHGRDRELAYQLAMRSAELKRDLEYAYVGSAAVGTVTAGSTGGSTSSARLMNGYQQMVASAPATTGSYTSALNWNGYATQTAAGLAAMTYPGSAALTEAMILSAAQTLFTNGIDPDTIMVKPKDALTVAGFASPSASYPRTRFMPNQGEASKTLVNVVDVYVCPFGDMKVVINRFSRQTDAFIFTPDMWKKAVLRNWTRVNLAKTGDFTQTMIVGEFGLQLRNFYAAGLITNLSQRNWGGLRVTPQLSLKEPIMDGISSLLRPSYSYVISTNTAGSATGSRVTPFGVVALRLCATQDCYVNIGPTPAAATTTGSMLVRASLPGEIFKAQPGDQVAAIGTSATASNLSVTEMTR